MEKHDAVEQASPATPEANDDASRGDGVSREDGVGRGDGVSRRGFIRTISVVGAGVAAGQAVEVASAAGAAKPAPKPTPKPAPKPPPKAKPAEIKIAMIGPGNQGRNLLTQCLNIEGVRFVAVCDIWDYSRTYAANILKKFDQPVRTYEDYHDMLAKEQELDAVIIATPDWMHVPISIACLEAGKHVYCEKEMSNSIEEAARLVQAWRKSGKLVQIGHQRRSNPRYWQVDNLIHKDKTPGKITHVFGQWNRSRKLDLGWPKDAVMPDELLKKYGYDTMQRFRNWRWYKKFAGGPIADLGSHQIDIFNWILRTGPQSVQSTGGADNYPDTEWYDNMLSLWDYKTEWGMVRGFYQVINTSSYGGYYEVFMGENAALEISENVNKGAIYPEPVAQQKQWVNEAKQSATQDAISILLNVGATLKTKGGGPGAVKKMTGGIEEKQPHLMHLENFFGAIRDPNKVKLTCPPDDAFRTCVTVLKANEALAKGCKVSYDPKDFEA